MRKGSKRHIFVYNLLHGLPGKIVSKARGYSYTRDKNIQIKEPFILVSNHCTDFDPILLGMSVKPHMYYVASEHIFNKGFLTKVLKFLFDPIPIRKGGSDITSVLEMKRRLADGFNIALFPEGGRNFAGYTEPIKAATGKLVRSFGTSLVTFRFEGGYLSSPRWSDSKRSGHFTGHIVNVYDAETLKGMTADQINSIIEKDIFQNDIDYQESNNYLYSGKNLAQSIERFFFVCPKCGSMKSLHSKNDSIYCDLCDFNATYGKDCHIHGSDLPFTRLDDWEKYQVKRLSECIENGTIDFEAFKDDGFMFSETLESGRKKFLGHCSVEMNGKEFIIRFNNPLNLEARQEPIIFNISDIAGMNQCGKNILVFSSKAQRFELKNKTASIRKYMELYSSVKEI